MEVHLRIEYEMCTHSKELSKTLQKLHWSIFYSTFSNKSGWAFLAEFSSDLVVFFKPHDINSSSYGFMVIERQRLEIRIEKRTLKTPTNPILYRCHFCICQSAIGNRIEREKLVYVYMKCIVSKASMNLHCVMST